MSMVDTLTEFAQNPVRPRPWVPQGDYLVEVFGKGRLHEREYGGSTYVDVQFPVKIVNPVDVDADDLADAVAEQGLTGIEIFENWTGQITFRVWGDTDSERQQSLNSIALKIGRLFGIPAKGSILDMFEEAVGGRCIATFTVSESQNGTTNWPTHLVSKA